jgi:hypothetical protein
LVAKCHKGDILKFGTTKISTVLRGLVDLKANLEPYENGARKLPQHSTPYTKKQILMTGRGLNKLKDASEHFESKDYDLALVLSNPQGWVRRITAFE